MARRYYTGPHRAVDVTLVDDDGTTRVETVARGGAITCTATQAARLDEAGTWLDDDGARQPAETTWSTRKPDTDGEGDD